MTGVGLGTRIDATEPDAAGASESLSELIRRVGGRSVVVGTSKDPNGKLSLLLFEEGAGQPWAAAKIPTTDRAAGAVEKEGRLLVQLRRLPLRGLMPTIPRVLQVANFMSRPVLVTTAVPGVPMSTRYHQYRHTARRRAVEADFAAVEGWLARLQEATRGPREPVDMDGGTGLRLAERFSGEPCFTEVIDRLAGIHRRLGLHRAPRSAVHGDLWFGNVLVGSAEVSGVLDWEAGDLTGEPVRDIVRFAVSYSLYLDRHPRPDGSLPGHPGLKAGRWGAGITYGLDGSGWFPALIRSFVRGGLYRLGVPAVAGRDAVLAGIAEIAAFADDRSFARAHLALFRSLAGRTEG